MVVVGIFKNITKNLWHMSVKCCLMEISSSKTMVEFKKSFASNYFRLFSKMFCFKYVGWIGQFSTRQCYTNLPFIAGYE